MKIFGKDIKEHLLESPISLNIHKDEGRRTYPLARNLFAKIAPSIIDFTKEDELILPIIKENLLCKKYDEELYFQDHALNLMAACIGERSSCSIHDYELVLAECKNIFGEQALEPLFQANIHSALLANYSGEYKRYEVIKKFKLFLERNYDSIKIPTSSLTKLYTALYNLSLQDTRKQYAIASPFFEEIELVFLEYQVEKKRHKIFTNSLQNKVSSIKEIAESTSSKVFAKIQANAKENSLANIDLNSSKLPINKDKVQNLKRYENFALAFREMQVLEKIQKFRELLVPQAFRIVVLGEGKRGKTSLINALLGKNILPTRAIIPETGTVLDLSYAKESSTNSPYTIEWINEQELEKLQNIIDKEEDNLLLKDKYKQLKEILNNEALFDILQSLKIKDIEELRKYSSADSIYSSIIKKISIKIDDDSVPKNVHFVDTPAINASDAFLHYLTKEECLKADCLVVVLDSRQPDTYNILNLLKEITKEGRVVKIVGILSHPLETKDENALAKERAIQTLQEGIREVNGIELIDVFSFNPHKLAEKIGKSKKLLSTTLFAKDEDIEESNFIQSLINIIENNRNYTLSEERLESSYKELSAIMQKSEAESIENNLQKLPSKEHISLLDKHLTNLEDATEKYANHARTLILSALHDIEEWRRNTELFIDHLEAGINLSLSNEMRAYADTLGNDFAKQSLWDDFDKEIAPRLAEKAYDEFLENKNTSLKMWEEKIETFSAEVGKLSMDCFNAMENSSKGIEKLFTTHSNIDHVLVQANSHIKKIALLLSGAGGGILASNGLANMLAFGTSFAILANTIVLPAISLAIGVYALNKLGDPVKRKKALLERKEEEIHKYSKKLADELNRQANEIQEELLLLYSKAIKNSLSPALEMMAYEAINMRLYLEFIKNQEKLCLENTK